MGPDESMMSRSSVKVINRLKLKDDKSNWITYKERSMNSFVAKGLRWHVMGTAQTPVTLVERNGSFFKPNMLSPLSDADLEKHETEQDEYDQKEAQVQELIYETVSNSVFLQIKGQPTAAEVWKAL
ncbi:hypothetical protein C8J56DRAFT_717393, partial [Mycena floridula]